MIETAIDPVNDATARLQTRSLDYLSSLIKNEDAYNTFYNVPTLRLFVVLVWRLIAALPCKDYHIME